MTQLSFEHISINETNDPLVDLSEFPFVLEPSYYNQGISPTNQMMIRRKVVEKLSNIQSGFDGQYRFKIWDGHRPRSVQDAIYTDYWQRLKAEHEDWSDDQLHHATEQFVTRATSQKRIPPHATGGAIDLTLVDGNGNELDMGTVFDHFGSEAEPFYFKDDTEHTAVHKNRMLLRDAMLKEGFTPDDDEWWHFDYGNQTWAVRAGAESALFGEA